MRTRSGQRIATMLAGIERESLLVAIVGFYTCGLVARLPFDQLRQDGWLALVTGRFIAHAGLPLRDSLTAWTAGVHWVDQQWLGQLILFRLDAVGGLKLVMLTNAALLALAVTLAVVAARRLGGSARSVALIAAPALFTIFLWAQLRTQTFAYPLFVCLAWLLIADARSPSRRVFLVLPLLVAWANLHGSVVLGAALVCLRGTFLLFKGPRIRGAALIFTPVACLFAAPYGLSLFGYYRDTAFNPSFSRLVTEWQRTTPSAISASFYVLAFIAVWLIGRQGKWITRYETLALLITLVAGMAAFRNTIWFSYLALIVLPTPLRHSLTPDAEQRGSRFRLAVGLTAGVAVVAVAIMAASRTDSWYEGKAYSETAAQAVAEAARSDPSARIFADIQYADWLLWKDPELAGRVVYDARLELLRGDRLQQLYNWTNRAGRDWPTAVQGSGLLVLDRGDGSPLGASFGGEDHWRRLYFDPHLAVFVRSPS